MDKPFFPAYEGDEPYVFVCYAHDDEDVVYPEIAWLREHGINIWYDEGISAGKVWRRELAEAIKGAHRILYYISQASLASDHCNREIDYALDQASEIVPVHLDETELTPEIDLALHRVQALHRSNDVRYQQHLLNTLGQLTAVQDTTVAQPKKSVWRLYAGLVFVVVVLISGGWWYQQNNPAKTQRNQIRDDHISIAVLPLKNLSSDPENAYMAEGLTEEIMTALANIPGLRLAGRTSSFYFQDNPTNLQTIGEVLNVRYLLEGSVRSSGDDFRVIVRLVQAEDGFELKSVNLDRRMGSIFEVQSEIATVIVAALEIPLTESDVRAAAAAGTNNQEAFSQFLRAKVHMRKDTLRDHQQTQRLLEAAIDLDPYFYRAYTQLHFSFARESFLTNDAFLGRDRQIALLTRVAELDPEGQRPTFARDQYVWHYLHREWPQAEQVVREKLKSGVRKHYWFSVYSHLLADVGLLQPALRYTRLAQETDPLNAFTMLAAGIWLYSLQQQELAVAEFNRCLELAPGHPLCIKNRARSLATMGDLEAALESVRQSQSDSQDFRCLLHGISHQPCSPSGDTSDDILNGQLSLYAGDFDTAFYWFDKAADEPTGWINGFRVLDRWPVEFRSDPRFKLMLERLNVTDEWRIELCGRANSLTPYTGVVVDC